MAESTGPEQAPQHPDWPATGIKRTKTEPDLPTHASRRSARGGAAKAQGTGGPATSAAEAATARDHLAHQAAERAAREAADASLQARRARLRRRRNLLLWSSPLMVVALVVVGKALSVPVIANGAKDSFDEQGYVEAAADYHRLQTWDVAEQWKVSFNEGTSLLAAGDLDPAETLLDQALSEVPAMPEDLTPYSDAELRELPACLVRTNLAVLHETRAEGKHTDADALVEEMKEEQEALDALGPDGPTDGSAAPDPEPFRLDAIATYLEAEELYRTANAVRIEGGCPDVDESRERATGRETEAREKREALENPPPPEGGGGEDDQSDPPPEGEEGEPPPPDPAEQERQEELQERAKDAELDKQQQEGYTDDGEPFDGGTPQW